MNLQTRNLDMCLHGVKTEKTQESTYFFINTLKKFLCVVHKEVMSHPFPDWFGKGR